MSSSITLAGSHSTLSLRPAFLDNELVESQLLCVALEHSPSYNCLPETSRKISTRLLVWHHALSSALGPCNQTAEEKDEIDRLTSLRSCASEAGTLQ